MLRHARASPRALDRAKIPRPRAPPQLTGPLRTHTRTQIPALNRLSAARDRRSRQHRRRDPHRRRGRTPCRLPELEGLRLQPRDRTPPAPQLPRSGLLAQLRLREHFLVAGQHWDSIARPRQLDRWSCHSSFIRPTVLPQRSLGCLPKAGRLYHDRCLGPPRGALRGPRRRRSRGRRSPDGCRAGCSSARSGSAP